VIVLLALGASLRAQGASVPVTPSKTEAETYGRVSRFVAGRYRQPSGKQASGARH
jgi:hypothetical protein